MGDTQHVVQGLRAVVPSSYRYLLQVEEGSYVGHVNALDRERGEGRSFCWVGGAVQGDVGDFLEFCVQVFSNVAARAKQAEDEARGAKRRVRIICS